MYDTDMNGAGSAGIEAPLALWMTTGKTKKTTFSLLKSITTGEGPRRRGPVPTSPLFKKNSDVVDDPNRRHPLNRFLKEGGLNFKIS